jgi:hypothetical protein
MPRRKNSTSTFLMFVLLVGAGWASYRYLYVERIFATKEVEAPPPDKEAEIRRAIAAAFSNDPCFEDVSNMGWRSQEFRWRVDVNIPDACRDQAKDVARRIGAVVKSASGGTEANVFVYTLGQEVARHVP